MKLYDSSQFFATPTAGNNSGATKSLKIIIAGASGGGWAYIARRGPLHLGGDVGILPMRPGLTKEHAKNYAAARARLWAKQFYPGAAIQFVHAGEGRLAG